MKRFFKIELSCLSIICVNIFLAGFVLELIVMNKSLIYGLMLCPFVLITVLFTMFLMKSGFGKSRLSPYTYHYEKGLSTFLLQLEQRFGKINYFDENAACILSKRHRMHLRILILFFDDITKDDFRKRKHKYNKIINKKFEINQSISLASVGKKMRINVLVVDEFNDYCHEIAEYNANISFSRVEAVLNVIFSKKEQRVLLPAHYGLNGFVKYNKILKQVEKALFH